MPTAGTASAAAGVIGLVLLTASLLSGIAVSQRRQLPRSTRYGSRVLHERLSLLALAFVTLHVIAAETGRFGGVGLMAVFVPFVTTPQRFWLGLGAISLDLLIAVTVTSLLRRRLGRRAWRAVHWTSYACWPAAEAHSLGFGTGMRSGRLLDLAVACAVAVAAAVTWRLTGDRAGGGRGGRRGGRIGTAKVLALLSEGITS
jgi:methionine sulfoxide reductase heme-binding subunit